MNTNIKEMVKEGIFPTTQRAALKLIDNMNALREIEVIREEEENKEGEPIYARHMYIKPVVNIKLDQKTADGKITGTKTYRKTGPTVFKEIIIAINKNEADRYIQAIIDKGAIDFKIDRVKSMMIVGWDKMKTLMDTLNEKYAKLPIVGFRTFRKHGYKILRRTYLKPSVRALAKAEVNFF